MVSNVFYTYRRSGRKATRADLHFCRSILKFSDSGFPILFFIKKDDGCSGHLFSQGHFELLMPNLFIYIHFHLASGSTSSLQI